MGLELGRAVMVGLRVCWVCYDGGLRLIIGGLRWWICTLQWVSEIFFFFILHSSRHCKIFFKLFSKMQSNTRKTIIFPKIICICICKYFTVENILRRNKRSPSKNSFAFSQEPTISHSKNQPSSKNSFAFFQEPTISQKRGIKH